MTVGQRHDPDRELFGQGIANLAVPLFGGVPATTAIARTALNVRAGAGSRLAAVTHSLVLAAIVLATAPLVGGIPLPALAGVLIATCVQMIEIGSLTAMLRATRADAVVLVITFLVTVAVGPLFFAAAHRFLLELTEIATVRVVILRLSRITSLDVTGAWVLGNAISRLEKRGIIVLLFGIRPGHDDILSTLGVADNLRADHRIFADTPTAIASARVLVGRTPR